MTINLSPGDTIAWQHGTYGTAGSARIIRPQWDIGPGPHLHHDASGNSKGAG
jgi:hypothetical protein